MGGNMIDILLDSCITAGGVYIIVQYFLMVTTKKLRNNFLIPKDIDLKKCMDQEGYIKCIGIRQLLFGIATVVCGGRGLVIDFYGSINEIFSLAAVIAFAVTAVLYIIAYKKALTQFWRK